MNILFYSYNFLPRDSGGMEKILLSIINNLKKTHQISLIIPSKHNISINDVKVHKIPEFNFELNNEQIWNLKSLIKGVFKILSNIISIIKKLPYILRKKEIDIVNVFQPSYNTILIVLISRIFGKKTIVNIRGIDNKVNKIFQVMNDLTLLFSKYIIVNSMDLLERYKKNTYLPKFLLEQKKCYYMPNGINIDFWKPNKVNPKKVYDIVFVGNLTDVSHIDNKGIIYLYYALKYLRKKENLFLKVLVIVR